MLGTNNARTLEELVKDHYGGMTDYQYEPDEFELYDLQKRSR